MLSAVALKLLEAIPKVGAYVIVGANVNGRTAWKRPDGTPFSEWQEMQLRKEE